MASSSSSLSRISTLQNHISPLEANNKLRSLVKISPQVSEAISSGRAVVALESTIISHGMPYPQNLQTAKEVESIVRENGAVPATIAILNGVPCIGLNEEELERLASLGKSIQKTAGRDIPHVVATRANGATTVSATLFFASMVGIQVFVTGGIGGVHRHANHTMDISSDLTALGRTPIAVISAGVKSILDIPKTLEYLETQEVYVAAYKSDEFPAFFTEKSGCKAPSRVDSPEDYANMKLNRKAGILFAVPIPKQHSAAGNLIESATQRALTEAREQNVTGNAETPFLLSRVNELTEGTSLAAISDIALVKNNALIGSQIAVALSQLVLKESSDLESISISASSDSLCSFLTTMAVITVDFQLCFIFIFLWLLTRFCLSAFFFKKQKDYNLPPSPPSLPVIGHLHHLLSVPSHKSFQKVSSKYGPLLHLRAFNISIVLVSSGSMAHEVLRTHGLNFATRDREVPIMEKSLLFGSFGFVSAPYGDYWKFMKKLLVTRLLGSHSLERTRLIRGEELKTFRAMLFDKAAKSEAVDVGEEMMKLTNNSICRMIMGRKCSEENGEAEQIRSLVTKSLGLVRKFLIASTVGRLLKKVGISLFEKEIMEVSERYDELLEKIIKEHEENPNQKEDRDMMDVLLGVCADDNAEFKISRNQIKALFVELLLGGTDTSAQTTQWIMAELINHPEILKTLREEIESVVGKTRLVQETDLSNLPYLQAVVKEGLRLHPHSPILVRTATGGCKIGEFYIPQNTTMIINSYAVMRDPDSWEEPDEFQPERFMVSPSKGKEEMREQLALNYLPFGSGRRGCPGTNLGYIFIGVAVGTMVQCFEWSVNGNNVNMEETGDMTLRMAHPLKCTLVARVDPFSQL
ncbi:hypothetical protein F2Q69_00046679 [Brassica cretica]|uniref:Pseudouridine-5'-phosphate glycosidase n=1 Tax=Brassica cretica TaxID=69181 RepID=A0A8S9PJT2_BRACR|nr:hypothetical protein F2Q69_00046679 [Brassica cretica]